MGKVIDMKGVEFNGCRVIKGNGISKDRRALWLCICYCGAEFTTPGKFIRNNVVKSCGCASIAATIETGKANKTHGMSKTRLYNIWRGMKKRCHLPSDTSYTYYGKRGIKVAEEWLDDFTCFAEWAKNNGYEEGLTIDRVDSSKGYSPSNCRWATYKEQGRNRSGNVRLKFRGDFKTKAEIAEELDISPSLLHYRIKQNIYKEDDGILYEEADK